MILKIGIVTHYYKNLNYGGNLQAYALCKVLQQYDVEPEQICIPLKGLALPWQRIEAKPLDKIALFLKEGILVRKVAHRLKRTVQKAAEKLLLPGLTEKRRQAFSYFNSNLIPHGPVVYDNETIAQCNDRYDAFITGSDQVWNLRWYSPAYFLAFAQEGKPKLSYGASASMNTLSQQEQALFQEHLRDYIGISVRERQTASMLGSILNRPVDWVLDPTLLLTKEQWDQVCAPRQVEEAYLFCYFLGKGRKERRLAEQLAKEKKLKIVTIPHMDGDFVPQDVSFGDIRLEGPSPEQYLSLIKHAQYVLTDSFHATIFSAIYQREYFVFCRDKGMDARIYSLTALLGSGARFCDSQQRLCVDYLLQCPAMDYSHPSVPLQEMKARSLGYLERCLLRAKEMANEKIVRK